VFTRFYSFMPRPYNPTVMAPRTRWIGGLVGSRAGLDDVDKRENFCFVDYYYYYYYYSEMCKNTDVNNSSQFKKPFKLRRECCGCDSVFRHLVLESTMQKDHNKRDSEICSCSLPNTELHKCYRKFPFHCNVKNSQLLWVHSVELKSMHTRKDGAKLFL
jgi:hypothetical protein